MSDCDTSTIGLMPSGHSLIGAALAVTVVISNASAKTDMISSGNTESYGTTTWASEDPETSELSSLYRDIRRGANILAASVDEEAESELDGFLAATAPPPEKVKLLLR